MTVYDNARFDQPAPVAHVTSCNVETGAIVSDTVLLLDTGADITLLPQSEDLKGIRPFKSGEHNTDHHFC